VSFRLRAGVTALMDALVGEGWLQRDALNVFTVPGRSGTEAGLAGASHGERRGPSHHEDVTLVTLSRVSWRVATTSSQRPSTTPESTGSR
jgi:hypothetical protein